MNGNGNMHRKPSSLKEVPGDNYSDFNLLSQHLEKLFSKLRISVIFGGDKTKDDAVLYQTHNTRSWKSYEAVAWDIRNAIKEIGFKYVTMVPSDMSMSGSLKKDGIHLAWLNTGGVQGFNPVCHTPAILEMLGIPYIGENPVNATILDNKHLFKQGVMGLEGLGIHTAPFITWNSAIGKLDLNRSKKYKAVFRDFKGPFIVKPVSGRASLHVHKVDSINDLPDVIEEVYAQTHNHVLIEKYLPGKEYCVGITGKTVSVKGNLQRYDDYFCFSEVERIFGPDEEIFTSMDKKAITKDRAKLLDSQKDKETIRKLRNLSQKVYGCFYMNGLVRLDIREDENEVLNVLEVNPKPDLKKPEKDVVSLVTLGLKDHGMSYNDLIYSMLADRIFSLISNGPERRDHIIELLES